MMGGLAAPGVHLTVRRRPQVAGARQDGSMGVPASDPKFKANQENAKAQWRERGLPNGEYDFASVMHYPLAVVPEKVRPAGI